jgi:hypothetical protein
MMMGLAACATDDAVISITHRNRMMLQASANGGILPAAAKEEKKKR